MHKKIMYGLCNVSMDIHRILMYNKYIINNKARAISQSKKGGNYYDS